MNDVLIEHAESIFTFGIVALLTNWVAWSKGFYLPLSSKRGEKNSPKLLHVLAVFAIYLGTSFLLFPILLKIWAILYSFFTSNRFSLSQTSAGYLQLFAILVSALLLFLFCKAQDQTLIRKIWKGPSKENAKSSIYDFGFGVVAWAVSFFPVAVVGQISDLFLYLLFGVENYEQVAVRYLKMTLSYFPLLICALFIILILAPVIEELLFRGFLQSYIRSLLGAKAAILLTSVGFALFHLSFSQGMGNISLAVSLFCFSCFLGYVYERQGSLFASIGLHVTFNTISSLRILFLQE